MQFTPRKFLSRLAFAFIAGMPLVASASYVVSTPGIGTQALGPSADTLTLNAGNATTPLGAFDLQTGSFVVGDSGSLSDNFNYTFNMMVTIDGNTEVVPISVDLSVTTTLDTLAILSSTSTVFFAGPNVDFKVLSHAPLGIDVVGGVANFALQGQLTEHVPEPGTLALVGVALWGVAISRRRPSRHVQA